MISPSRAGESDCGLRARWRGDVGGGDRAVDVAVAAVDAEVGHRGHVVALGRRRPVVAGAEEADRELGLGLRRCSAYVGRADRRADGGVPGDLAVGLHEVGVAVGEPVELVERVVLEVDALLGRPGSRQARSAISRGSRSTEA